MGRKERPLDPADGPVPAFALGLRRLRRQAGSPSYRTLAERTHFSVATLSRAAAGNALPSAEVTWAFVAACGGDAAAWLLERERVKALTDPESEPDRAPGSTPADTAPAGAAAQNRFPHQLPADTRAFTGRVAELRAIVTAATEQADGPGTVVIGALDGMGGVGKSALAVHAAHKLSARFPDGQLFVDLRGSTAGLEPLSAMDALYHLLTSLGVPAKDVPADAASRAAFYRSRLSGTRTLVVLDNAAGTAQVRPLLPGAAGCLVLITSRKRLSGLDDAQLLTVGVLEDDQALALLRRLAGPERIQEDDPKALELITLCGRLPLAIRIVAARLRNDRWLALAELVEALREESERLAHLKDDDRDMAAVFDTSYASLSAAEQRLFRLLGLIPGVDADAYATAALLDSDLREAERLLEALVDHSLLTQHAQGRYRMHDLVRVYSRSLNGTGTPGAQQTALARLLDYYQEAAELADRMLARHALPAGCAAPAGHSGARILPKPREHAEARAWLRAERANLLAALEHATALDQPERIIRLTFSVTGTLGDEGNRSTLERLHRTATDAAQRLGDTAAERASLLQMGRIKLVAADFASTAALLERVLALCEAADDRLGAAHTLKELGSAKTLAGERQAADELLKRALAGYEALDDIAGRAATLSLLGQLHTSGTDLESARRYFMDSIALFQEAHDPKGRAVASARLGRLLRTVGDPAGAIEAIEQARELFRETQHRSNEAGAELELGLVRSDLGEYRAAVKHFEFALQVHREVENRQFVGLGLFGLGQAQHALADFDAAIESFEESLAVFDKLGSRVGSANARHGLAQVHHALGDFTAAANLLARASEGFREAGNRRGEAMILASQGDLAFDTADADRAGELYERALAIAREARGRLEEGRALEGRARCAERTGDLDAAAADLRKAVTAYRAVASPRAEAAAAALVNLNSAPTAGPSPA